MWEICFLFSTWEDLGGLQKHPFRNEKYSPANALSSLITNTKDRTHLKLSHQSNWAWSQSAKLLTFVILMAPLQLELLCHHFHYRLLLLWAYCLVLSILNKMNSTSVSFQSKCKLLYGMYAYFILNSVKERSFILSEIMIENQWQYRQKKSLWTQI